MSPSAASANRDFTIGSSEKSVGSLGHKCAFCGQLFWDSDHRTGAGCSLIQRNAATSIELEADDDKVPVVPINRVLRHGDKQFLRPLIRSNHATQSENLDPDIQRLNGSRCAAQPRG